MVDTTTAEQKALSHLEAARRELLQVDDETAKDLFADTNVVPDISYVILVLKGLLEDRGE